MRFLVVSIGVLALGCQQPDLSTTQQESVILSPLSHDFGSLEVGATSAPFALSVNPAAGANDDFVTAISASCPDFRIDAPGLPAEVYRTCDTTTCAVPCYAALVCTTIEYVNYTFNAAFSPTVAGSVSCVVTVELNGATTHTLTLSGTGTLPPVAIDVAPATIDFGEVRRDTDSSSIALVVHDGGGAPLAISAVTISPGFAIVAGQTAAHQIPPGGNEGYKLVCHPTTVGALTGELSISSNDPNRGTVTVPLTCKGIDSAMALTPSPAMIPSTRVGEPAAITIDIGNTGAAAMNLEGVALSGPGLTLGGAIGASVIPPGGTVPVTVQFDAATAGDASGALVATYDGGQTNTAQISARALATSMALSPDGDIDFGPVCAGQTKAQTFTILGNAEGTFLVTGISQPAAPFTLTAPSLPLSVAGAGASQLSFTVAAAPSAAGHATAMLTVTTDIPGGAPHTINLAVDALTAGVTPTPASLDFGSNPIETTTIGQAVHVSNCGTGPVAWSNPRIEGPGASEFAIVAQPEQPTIPAMGFASWLIVLQAHAVGPTQAMFTVDYEGGSASVLLDGEGLGAAPPVDTTTPSESSYYSCQTGRAAGGWPLAVALAFAWRRRRSR